MKNIYLLLVLFYFLPTRSQTLNFPTDTIARDDFYNYRSMMKHDANGNLHNVNSRQLGANSSTREVFYRTNISGHFDTLQLSNNSIDDNYATFDFDNNQRVHFGWERRDANNDFQVVYANLLADTLSAPVWITSGGLNKATPSIAIGKDSLVHFVYLTFVLGQDFAYYRTYNFITHTLSAEINLGAMEASSENDIEVAVDAANHVHIVFATNGTLSTSALKYFNNESGTLMEFPTGQTAYTEYPDIMIDENNTLHIIYRISSDKRIYTIERPANGSCTAPKPVTPPNVGNPSYWRAFDTDSVGRLYVTYQNSVNNGTKGIFLVHGKNGNFSAPLLVFEDSSGQYVTRGSSSVAARGNGEIAVLFDVAGTRSGQVFSDIFLKKGTLIFTEVDNISTQQKKTLALFDNYPNPFNPQTVISFSLFAEENIVLNVYDIFGKEVATLVDEKKDAETYSVQQSEVAE